MLIIGLTGNLASGKTTVAKIFQKLGAKVLDADRIAHRLLKRGQPCFPPVVRHFVPSGKGILVGGEIDRRKLAQIVFNDAKELQALNKIVHPKVIQEISRQLRTFVSLRAQRSEAPAPAIVTGGPGKQSFKSEKIASSSLKSAPPRNDTVIVIEAALLIESGLNELVDVVVIVKASRSLQVKRAVDNLKITEAEALKRIKMQMNIKEKLKIADIVIDNRGNLNQTKQQVEDIWQRLIQRKTAK